jgi:hypothetical protein
VEREDRRDVGVGNDGSDSGGDVGFYPVDQLEFVVLVIVVVLLVIVVLDDVGSGAAAYAMTQVATHNTSASCWAAVSGDVYDLTTWIGKHPGGSGVIKAMCGTDATSAFLGQHSGERRPVSELATFKIGTLAG